jgi:predicted membrane channel-forming protein YqfA (hemolysin III family)
MNALSAFIAKIVTLIIQPIVVLLLTAGVAYFIWGVAMYIFNSDSADERKKGTQHIIWSLVGILIMVGVIGILRIVTSTFGVDLPSN